MMTRAILILGLVGTVLGPQWSHATAVVGLGQSRLGDNPEVSQFLASLQNSVAGDKVQMLANKNVNSEQMAGIVSCLRNEKGIKNKLIACFIIGPIFGPWG